MNNLVKTDLSKICSKVTDGTHDSPKILKKGVPFIKGKHLINGLIDFDNCDYISLDDHEKVIKRSKVEKGDILFSNIGSVGVSAYVKTEKEFSIKNVALFKPNKELIDGRYLYYIITSPMFIKGLLNKKQGVAQPFLSLNLLRNHKFYYFENIKYQKKVSSVLSTYDELIENNTRRIEVLEEMAQRIYKEWFVDFKYPGHENDKLVDSELGMIPESWEVISLDSIMQFKGGSQPPKSEWHTTVNDDSARMIQIRDYQSDKYIMYVNKSKKLRYCNEYDIMIARYGASVGRICYGLKGAYNVALVKVLPKKDFFQEFLRSYLQSNYFQKLLIGMSGRTAQEGFNKQTFSSIRISFPKSEKLLIAYNDICKKFYKERLILIRKNNLLKQTRDYLLPKLISGKVDVSELDIDTGILDD